MTILGRDTQLCRPIFERGTSEYKSNTGEGTGRLKHWQWL